MTTNNDFFVEALYTSSSIPDAIDSYIKFLRKQGDGKSLLHANKLQEYKELFSSDTTMKLRNVFDGLYKILSETHPKLRFTIEGRRKSFVSLEQKIRRNLKFNNSLDLIRDMFGVRVILLNGNEQDCFLVMEALILFCLQRGYTVCEENLDNKPPQWLSHKCPLSYQFYYGLTDYISYPKKNGYKSIHAIFRSIHGKFFEVQVRTQEMDVDARYGGSKHEEYKRKKYEQIKFDRSRIKIPGYYYPLPSGEAEDRIGLEEALNIIVRNKTF